MSKNPVEYLLHIHDECLFILQVSEPLTSKDELLQDETIKRAIVRSLEIIGEATKKIPEIEAQIAEVIDKESDAA